MAFLLSNNFRARIKIKKTSKSLFLILGRSSVVEVPVHVKRCARRQNMCIIASLKYAGTSTTEDWPSIRNKLFDVLPGPVQLSHISYPINMLNRRLINLTDFTYTGKKSYVFFSTN